MSIDESPESSLSLPDADPDIELSLLLSSLPFSSSMFFRPSLAEDYYLDLAIISSAYLTTLLLDFLFLVLKLDLPRIFLAIDASNDCTLGKIETVFTFLKLNSLISAADFILRAESTFNLFMEILPILSYTFRLGTALLRTLLVKLVLGFLMISMLSSHILRDAS
jgi:hypothetical protein